MTTHLLRDVTSFVGTDGCDYADAFAWCDGSGYDQQYVVEAALSDCEACLSARAEALHQVKGKNVLACYDKEAHAAGCQCATDTKRREAGCACHLEEGDSPCPVHDRVEVMKFQKPPLPSRGERALVLLKELNQLRATGKSIGATEFHSPPAEWTSAWHRVKELLAEEMPGTVKP